MPRHIPFSEQIRAAVDAFPESRAELCRRADIDQSVLSRFMTGERGLTLPNLDKLIAALGLQLSPVRKRTRR